MCSVQLICTHRVTSDTGIVLEARSGLRSSGPRVCCVADPYICDKTRNAKSPATASLKLAAGWPGILDKQLLISTSL